MNDGLTRLESRGFASQCTDRDSLQSALGKGPVTFYVGFDPTAPSLHAGHLVQLLAMSHLQQAGHQAICLIGGGTALVGDPTGKTESRRLLQRADVAANARRLADQVCRVLDPARTLILNNLSWLGELNYLEFLREIGRHFSVNRMLTFETYRTRLEAGLSFLEFNYILLQSYDFLVLHQRHGCLLQLGGDDQWGNIVAGIDLIRRVESAPALGLTTPLVTMADGSKMGKSERGALYLDPELLSPYDFYQYWVNVPDRDVRRLLLLLTFLPEEEVQRLSALRDQELNQAKRILAFEVTRIAHGEREATAAREGAAAVFAGADSSNAAVPSAQLSRQEIQAGVAVVELLARAGLAGSRGEARRLIQQGGAYLNGAPVGNVEATVGTQDIVDGAIGVRAGKKRHFRFVIS